MSTSEGANLLDRVAEALVLADLNDLRSLADTHTAFIDLGKWAGGAGNDPAGKLCETCAGMIEKIILEEAANPAEIIEQLGEVVANMQTLIRDGLDMSQFSWPAGFVAGAAPPSATTATPQCEGGGAPQATSPAVPSIIDDLCALQGDPALLSEFVAEAREHLDASDTNLLKLETDAGDSEALNAVFRAFHTIKGVAGFLALDAVKTLAHEAENLLDKTRKGELQLSGAAMDVTFDAVDMMKRLISDVAHSLENGSPLPPVPELPALIEKIKCAAEGAGLQNECELPSAAPGQPLGEILLNGRAVTKRGLDRALDQQNRPADRQKLGELLVREGKALPSHIQMAVEAQTEGFEESRLGEILVEMGVTSPQAIESAVRQQEAPRPQRLGQLLVSSGQAAAKDVAQALRAQNAAAQAPTQLRETVKVDADRLDALVDTIGELVIAESMVRQSKEMKDTRSATLMRSLTQLGKITRELQEMGTSLRMVPIRSTFQKMARLVRDLAKKAGKQVEFNMSGEDTELDKSVVDKIGDPLVHMIRNAVDHGLEADPDERTKAGKNPIGRISLRAFHKGGNIYIEIEDDGRGLDKKAVLAKARDRGLVTETSSLSDHEIYNLIFEPGLSTAKTVTDVSGRGVGMDVVKRNIEGLRGQVDISSEEGKGSRFTIRLPLTLAIIDGMVVSVGAERFIIPTLSMIMSIRPEPHHVSTVVGQAELLSLQGEILPLFRLTKLFGIPGVQAPFEGTVIIVEDEGRRYGFLVDKIVGQQQTVIKSLGDAMQGIDGIAGGAIMADGNVGLILDVGGLLRLAHEEGNSESSLAKQPPAA